MAIAGVLIALVLSIAILYYRSRERKQHLEAQIETDRYAHLMQQKALSGKLKRSNEALHDALKRLENNSVGNENQSEPQTVQNYVSFVEMPICRYILETVQQQKFKSKIDCVVYKEYALQKEQMLLLRLACR